MPPKTSERRRSSKDAPRKVKKKVCIFCAEKISWVDYKDVNLLRRFMSERGKIRARRVSGNCQQHQRDVAIAIKTARELALLPYTQRTTTERGPRGAGGGGGRGPGRGRGDAGDNADLEVVEAEGPEAADGEAPDVADVVGLDAAGGDEAGGDE
jgi:small subunit ribosomal protein S18